VLKQVCAIFRRVYKLKSLLSERNPFRQPGMKVLPNAFGIAAMFTLDPDTPELATVLFLKNIMMSYKS
jgi:hypothetical protein